MSSPSDQGSGSVLTLGLVAVVIMCAVVLAGLSTAQDARGRAQTAADLAALAAAGAFRFGQDPCQVARESTRRNGAQISGCTTEPGGIVRIAAQCDAGGLLGVALGQGEAEARAGPALEY